MVHVSRRHIGIGIGMIVAVALTSGAMIMSTADAKDLGPVTGKAAPAFTGQTSDGKTLSLSDFAGKRVVLEWTNHDCPFVVKHYASGNMQDIQKDLTDQGVVWLTVVSSAPGKQGHVSAAAANALTTDRDAAPTAVILDETGDIGRLYAAKTTPHMYIINEAGTLVYQGAIDDKPSASKATLVGATNYVNEAFAALDAGQMPDPGTTKPYGCSVKY